jgi:endoglycosylceramidase
LVVVGLVAATAAACSGGGGDEGEADAAAPGEDPAGCDGSVEAPEPRFVVDDCGRVVLLRGTNVESSSKGGSQDDDHLPASGWESQQHLGQLGWNAVRFLVFWGAVEPEEGRYDEAYLDEVEAWLDRYAEQGIHVVLDMHQDVYGWAVGGNGAPDWAVVTDGLEVQPLPEGQPWYLAAADPAAQRAYQNFWDPSRGHGELREHFVAAWSHVARRFADHPAVIGYDILNEPVFANGDLTATLAIQAEAAAGNFHNPNLTELSQDAIDAIRAADDDAWIMVEPTSLVNAFPYPGDLVEEDLHDPRDGPPRLVYAPHLYEPSVHDGNGYAEDSAYVGRWEQYRVAEADRLGGGLYIGEFGGSPDNERMDDYLADVMAMADRNMLGWAQWSWDPPEDAEGSWSPVTVDGELTANGRRLARVQPRAIAGVPESFGWDAAAGVFRMAWRERDGVEGPTELGVPVGAWDGEVEVVLDGEVVDADEVEAGLDEERGVLRLAPPDRAPEHEVCVRWGADAGPC